MFRYFLGPFLVFVVIAFISYVLFNIIWHRHIGPWWRNRKRIREEEPVDNTEFIMPRGFPYPDSKMYMPHVHTKTGKQYIPTDHLYIQIDGKWYRGILYVSNHRDDERKYARTVKDFEKSFKQI